MLSCWWRHQWRCCGPVSVWRAAQNRQRVMFQLVGWSGTLSYTCPCPWLGDVWLWYDVSDLFSKTGVRMALTRYHRTSPIRDGLHIDTLAIGRPERARAASDAAWVASWQGRCVRQGFVFQLAAVASVVPVRSSGGPLAVSTSDILMRCRGARLQALGTMHDGHASHACFMQWITYFPVCAVLRPLRILNAWNCLWLVPFRLQVLGQTSKRMPTFSPFLVEINVTGTA